MAFCKYCGKEIPDGSVCSCDEAQAAVAAEEKNVSNTPVPDSNITSSDEVVTGTNIDKNSIIMIAGAAAAVIVVILLCVFLFGGGYKKPLKNVVKGFNKEDPERIVSAIFTEDMIEDSDEWDGDYDDCIDAFEDAYDEVVDEFEDEYGKNVKIKYEIDNKKAIKEKKLSDYEDLYDDDLDMKVEIKKGYKLELTVSIEGDKDDEEFDEIELVVVKIKGEGWVICPFDGGFGSLLY